MKAILLTVVLTACAGGDRTSQYPAVGMSHTTDTTTSYTSDTTTTPVSTARATNKPVVTGDTTTTSAEATGPGARLGDQGQSAAELQITASIRRGLAGDASLSYSAKNVQIITTAKKVTLRGRVNSVREIQAIVTLASRTYGVQQLDNQLELKP